MEHLRMKFQAVIESSGKTATGIQVPEEVVTALGSGKRPAVSVTMNNFTYRTTVAPLGGVYMIPVSSEIRKAAGVAAGDHVEVDLQLDTQPREVSVPPDFAEALARDAAALRFFESLSYSNKRRFVLGIEEAKTAETRQRRIEKAISTLREERV
jgi:hypothetical protein